MTRDPMTGVANILSALEENLKLERELGVRTVEFDRSLLLPPAPVARPADPVSAANAAVEVKASPAEAPAAAPAASPATPPSAAPVKPSGPAVARPDYLFVGEPMAGGARELLKKIVLAMGLRGADMAFVPVSRQPAAADRAALAAEVARLQPKCIVLFGRPAVLALLPEQSPRRGVWGLYRDIPVMTTYHPAFVLALSPETQRAAKVELWSALKAALARLGRTPPPRA